MAVVTVGTDFTDVGHLMALILGMVVATRFGTPRRWTWPLALLLAVAAPFGFVVLSGTDGVLPLAAASGLAGGLQGTVVTLLRARRGLPEVDQGYPQSPIHPQAGSLGFASSLRIVGPTQSRRAMCATVAALKKSFA